MPTLSPDNPLFKGQTLKTKIADAVLSVGPHFEKPLPTSDYETSARETIRLGDIVSSLLIVSDGGNTVNFSFENFSFENVINTQAARLKSQQILDDIKGTVLGDAINNEFNFPRGQAFSILTHNILITNILNFSTYAK